MEAGRGVTHQDAGNRCGWIRGATMRSARVKAAAIPSAQGGGSPSESSLVSNSQIGQEKMLHFKASIFAVLGYVTKGSRAPWDARAGIGGGANGSGVFDSMQRVSPAEARKRVGELAAGRWRRNGCTHSTTRNVRVRRPARQPAWRPALPFHGKAPNKGFTKPRTGGLKRCQGR